MYRLDLVVDMKQMVTAFESLNRHNQKKHVTSAMSKRRAAEWLCKGFEQGSSLQERD